MQRPDLCQLPFHMPTRLADGLGIGSTLSLTSVKEYAPDIGPPASACGGSRLQIFRPNIEFQFFFVKLFRAVISLIYFCIHYKIVSWDKFVVNAKDKILIKSKGCELAWFWIYMVHGK